MIPDTKRVNLSPMMQTLIKIYDHSVDAIKDEQASCSHPQHLLDKVNKSDTGNWDPSDNSYWAEYFCTSCGKSWMGDQNERKGRDE